MINRYLILSSLYDRKYINYIDEHSFQCMYLCYILTMISITAVHIKIQADSYVSDTNRVINFWLWSMATRGEKDNSYYADPTQTW